MVAAIVKCVRSKPPRGVESGAAPNVYEAQWRVELDDEAPFSEMLRLARLVTPGSPSANDKPIPKKGDLYRWVTAGSTTDRDDSAVCLDFDCRELLDDGKTWVVEVRWRQPTPGAEEEPIRVKRTTVPNRRLPDRREPYRWIEYFTEVKDVTDALNLRTLGVAGLTPAGLNYRKALTKGPLQTAAGEEVEKATSESMHSVFVTERNVRDQRTAHSLNARFSGAINKDSFEHPLLRSATGTQTGNIGKLIARYLRAETSQYPFWENGKEWFKMQIRVQVQSTPFQIDVANRGILYWGGSSDNVIKTNRDDDGVVQMTNLTRTGERTTTQPPIIIPYITSRVVSFSSLTRFL